MTIFENLSELKTQLFDAPSEVKVAFNAISQYFSNDSESLYALWHPAESYKYEDMSSIPGARILLGIGKSVDDLKSIKTKLFKQSTDLESGSLGYSKFHVGDKLDGEIKVTKL